MMECLGGHTFPEQRIIFDILKVSSNMFLMFRSHREISDHVGVCYQMRFVM